MKKFQNKGGREMIRRKHPYVIGFVLVCIMLQVLSAAPGCAEDGRLILPDAVTEIGNAAFFGDNSINEVVLPEGIISIGLSAFEESTVKKINLPDSIRFIDLFELFLSILIALVRVRMIAPGLLPVGFFDIFVGSAPLHAEHFIEVPLPAHLTHLFSS